MTAATKRTARRPPTLSDLEAATSDLMSADMVAARSRSRWRTLIVTLVQNGEPAAAVARVAGCSRQRIGQILADAREEVRMQRVRP